MSRKITKEMKHAAMDSYFVDVFIDCQGCILSGSPRCHECAGEGHKLIKVAVPWTICKEIYRAMSKASPK